MKAGYSIVGERLMFWPYSTPQWGWGTDAHGRVFNLGWLTYYVKKKA